MNEVQNFNTHSFSPYLAEKYGWKDAVFLQHIYYWVKHNKGKGSNCHDGNWWTYNTRKGFAEYFRYLTEDDIRGIIERLEEKKMLITGNYNKIPWDKTKWYALTEFSWQLFGDTIGEIPQSKGDKAKSNGDETISSGEETKSKDDNSPDNTNPKISKTSITHTKAVVKDFLEKKVWSEEEVYNEVFAIFDERLKGKNIQKLVPVYTKFINKPTTSITENFQKAFPAWVESFLKTAKNRDEFIIQFSSKELPEVEVDPTLDFSFSEEEKKEIRSKIKFLIGNLPSSQNGYHAGYQILASAPIARRGGVWILKISEDELKLVIQHEEVLKQIKVEIEVK